MITVVAAIIRRKGQILITRRFDNVPLPGLWEFPGGKVKSNESLHAALKREIREELGIEIDVLDEYFFTEHHYPGRSVRLHFFNCSITAGEPTIIEVADLRWVRLSELRSFAFPEGDSELIASLQRAD